MFGFFQRLFRKQRFLIDVASISERGLVRAENQDHVLVNRERATFCVADGMGGGEGGATASDMVCLFMARAVAKDVDFGERVKRVDEAFRSANAAMRAYAYRAGFKQMASTATVLLADEADAGQAVIGYVGDSRVYRCREGLLTLLTHDHTMAGELMRRSAGHAMSVEFHGRQHAFAHILTRAVGVEAEVRPEWRKIDMRKGDVYLICSDGVHDMLSSEEIRTLLSADERAQDLVAALSARILSAGAVDNYSMVVLKIGGRE